MVKIKSSEITPEHVYMSRRRFIKGVGAVVASSVVLAACGTPNAPPAARVVKTSPAAGSTASPTGALIVSPTIPVVATQPVFPPLSASADELG
jgi:hypothetical protein